MKFKPNTLNEVQTYTLLNKHGDPVDAFIDSEGNEIHVLLDDKTTKFVILEMSETGQPMKEYGKAACIRHFENEVGDYMDKNPVVDGPVDFQIWTFRLSEKGNQGLLRIWTIV